MTKQEHIEEMVNVMIASNNPFVDVPIEVMPKVAKALYNAGYRKVPEGTLAMTKEELVKTMESGYAYDTTRGNKVNLIEMAREVERKETAKRIYEKAKKKKYIDNDDEGCYWGAIALDDLADICGVEVEE